MAIHYKDKNRTENPVKPHENSYRLLGVNKNGKPYFYWSDVPAQFAAYLGPNDPYGVWGTLDKDKCKNNMKEHHKVFIANYETAIRLESSGVIKPCGKCNKVERRRYEANGNLQVNRKVEIE